MDFGRLSARLGLFPLQGFVRDGSIFEHVSLMLAVELRGTKKLRKIKALGRNLGKVHS